MKIRNPKHIVDRDGDTWTLNGDATTYRYDDHCQGCTCRLANTPIYLLAEYAPLTTEADGKMVKLKIKDGKLVGKTLEGRQPTSNQWALDNHSEGQ